MADNAWVETAQLLIALTCDLRPLAPSTDSDLLSSRKDIVSAIESGQARETFGIRIKYDVPRITISPGQFEAYNAAKPTTNSQPPLIRAVRRTLNAAINLDRQNVLKDTFGLQPSKSHGPFMDDFGRTVFIDVFTPLNPRSYSFGTDGPHLYVGAPVTSVTPYQDSFGTGMVWIRAAHLTKQSPAPSQAPPTTFIGLQITKGEIVMPPVPSVPVILRLELAESASSGTLFSITPVTTVAFSFSRPPTGGPGAATLLSINTGKATILGSSLSLAGPASSVVYDSSMGTLKFKMNVDTTTFKPSSALSRLMNIAGSSTIDDAYWTVPVKHSGGTSFFDMTNPSGFSFAMTPGVYFTVRDEAQLVPANTLTADVRAGLLIISGKGKSISGQSYNVTLASSTSSMPRGQGLVTWRPPEEFPFYYTATAEGAESWTINTNLTITLERPLTARNERVPITNSLWPEVSWNTISWYLPPMAQEAMFNIQASNDQPETIIPYTLKNLFLRASRPENVEITGRLQAGTLISGQCAVVSFMRYSIPILQDPYVSNLELRIDRAAEKNGLGYIIMISQWTDTGTTPVFSVDLLSAFCTSTKVIERYRNQEDPAFAKITQYWDSSFATKEVDSGVIPDRGIGYVVHYPNRGGALRDGVYCHPPTLLDISSNQGQLGVIFGTIPLSPAEGRLPSVLLPTASETELEDFSISDLMLCGRRANIRTMALPATHWEPITQAQDLTTIPTRLGATYEFPYSGPTTQIALKEKEGRSVRLVPASPQEALDDIIETYNGATLITPVTVTSRLTLPFGMVGLAMVDNKPVTEIPLRGPNPGTVSKIVFETAQETHPNTVTRTPELRPQAQIKFTPPSARKIIVLFPPRPIINTGDINSPSFPGTTTLLFMDPVKTNDHSPPGATPPSSTPLTNALYPADTAFRDDMQERVPLQRFDISGYGASIFSDWKRVVSSTGISAVLMNILNGRTAREVVVMQSVMAPFAVKVSKTIEMRRLNSGVVVRNEGPWIARSDGRYFYPNAGIITHPGVVRGVTDVRNIREIRSGYQVPGSIRVDVTKFDCIVELEDGGELRRIPARDIDGCVFLEKSNTSNANLGPSGALAPGPATGPSLADYKAILDDLKLGGRIDANIQIGKSGQQKRITSLSVDIAAEGKAVAAAWGSLVFAGSGQWSLAKIGSDGSSQVIDVAKGSPLVRMGEHTANFAANTASYLLKEPKELLNSASSTVYGIIHGAADHRVLFWNPEIPYIQNVPGILAEKVHLADSFALGKLSGIFPDLNDCIEVIPDLENSGDIQKQLLGIVPGGYSFNPQKIFRGVLQGTDLDIHKIRTLADSAGVTTVVRTVKDAEQGWDDVKAALNLAIDTSKNISKMDITNVQMVTMTVNDVEKRASMVVGKLRSDATKLGGLIGAGDLDLPDTDPGKILASPLHKFGPALDQVRKVISFLESLKFLPHFRVSMTNEWALLMSTSMNREDLLKKIPEASRPPVEKVIEAFDFNLSSRSSLAGFLLTLHAGASIKIPTGFGPIVAIGKGAFDVALGTTGNIEIKLDLGFGIGVDFSVGPFSASASFTQSQQIIVTESGWGVGITACMRAHVSLVVASADLYLEASLLVVGGTCKPELHNNVAKPEHAKRGSTIWAHAKVRIAIHVSIFLICNISVDEEAAWENRLNGGLCELEHMTDLPK